MKVICIKEPPLKLIHVGGVYTVINKIPTSDNGILAGYRTFEGCYYELKEEPTCFYWCGAFAEISEIDEKEIVREYNTQPA